MASEPAAGRVAVEFRVENDRYPFVGASEAESCTFELEEMIPRGDGVYSEFFRIRGADADSLLDRAAATPNVRPTLLSERADECLFEFEVEDGCIAVSLADAGAHPWTVRGDDGDGTVVADLPRDRGRDAVRDVLADHDGVTVVDESPGGVSRPESARQSFLETVHEALAPRQRGPLITALTEGFYDWPRRTTLEDLAATLDANPGVLDARLHNAEQTLLAALFENGTLDSADEPLHPFSNPNHATE